MKNQIQKMKKWFKNKKAFAVDTAIKVLTAVVLGALILMGLYGIINGAVIPKTKDKIESMYAISDAGVNAGGSNDGAGEGTGGGNLFSDLNPGSKNKVIPEAAVYKTASGETLTTFPISSQNGDTYMENNNTYIYQNVGTSKIQTFAEGFLPEIPEEEYNGWKYICEDKNIVKAEPIKESINGKPVLSISHAFGNCTKLIEAPEIPSSVIDMSYAFFNCTSLTKAPIISKNVSELNGTFESCTSLSGIVEINTNPDIYSNCFKDAGSVPGCITLTGTSNILNELAATNSQGNVVVKN